MRFLIQSSSILFLAVTSCHAFVPLKHELRQHRQLTTNTFTAVGMSTLAPRDVQEVSSDSDDGGDKNPSRLSKGGISMSVSELAKELGGKGRAQIAWDCYSIGIDPANFFGSVISLGFDDYETIYGMLPSSRRTQRLGPDTLQKLSDLYATKGGQVEGGVASLSHISRSADGTTKLLLKMADGLQVETVIIPWKGQRSTLCISSQVGCKQGCTFCATGTCWTNAIRSDLLEQPKTLHAAYTQLYHFLSQSLVQSFALLPPSLSLLIDLTLGRMGKLRDLTSDEILAQMFFAKKICRLQNIPEIKNIVFMGMGEAADNSENVITATEILTTRELFQLSATKVTVSTVGPTPESFKKFAKAPCALAWSVHAANDDLRKKLVPTTKYTMAELRQGLIDTLLQRPMNFRSTMLEVALMADVNDTLEAADELAKFAQVIIDEVPGCKLIVNLIPYNDIGQTSLGYKKPSNDSVKAFQVRLQEQNIFTHIRTTRGDDKTAACGQLATSKKANVAATIAPKVTP